MFQVEGLTQAISDDVRMLGNTYNYNVKDVYKSINYHSEERFFYGITFTAYSTFILAFVVINIALKNILIELSLNIAKEESIWQCIKDLKCHGT